MQFNHETNNESHKKEADFAFESTDLSDLKLMPEVLFERFIRKYNKNYVDETEKTRRYLVFRKNYLSIKELNLDPNDPAVYGINHLTDLENHEITGLQLPYDGVKAAKPLTFHGNLSSLPDSFDWRKKGAVTPVKNQGSCGSCWTFSTTGVIEGAYFVKHNKLYSFSEQELMDCDDTNGHCTAGGWPKRALE